MWEMQVGGAGTIRTIGNFKTAPDSNDRTLFPNTGPTSTAVMYDVGKIIQVGGNGYYNGYPTQSSKAATTFDINGISTGSVVVRETAPMANGRQWASANVLPNGHVLVTGGSRFGENGCGVSCRNMEPGHRSLDGWSIRSRFSRLPFYGRTSSERCSFHRGWRGPRTGHQFQCGNILPAILLHRAKRRFDSYQAPNDRQFINQPGHIQSANSSAAGSG